MTDFAPPHKWRSHEEMAQMWAAKIPAEQIAKKLHYGGSNVIYKIRYKLFQDTKDPRLARRPAHMSGNGRKNSGLYDRVIKCAQQGLSRADIAERLNCPLGTVKPYLWRAKREGHLPALKRAAKGIDL